MITHIQLTNSITSQVFDFYVDHTTNTQLYYRVKVLMTQIAIIEDINEQNVSFNIPQELAA